MGIKTRKYSFEGILTDGFFGEMRAYLALGNPYAKNDKWFIDVYMESLINQTIFVTVLNRKAFLKPAKITLIYPRDWHVEYELGYRKTLIDDFEVTLGKGNGACFRIALDENTVPGDSFNFILTSRLFDLLKDDFRKSVGFGIPTEKKTENVLNIFSILKDRGIYSEAACV